MIIAAVTLATVASRRLRRLHEQNRSSPRRRARHRKTANASGPHASDFEVLDNGVCKFDLASFEEITLNVVVALDMSASLQGLRLGHLQAAGRAVVDGLKPVESRGSGVVQSRRCAGIGTQRRIRRIRAALDQAQGSG